LAPVIGMLRRLLPALWDLKVSKLR